MAYAVGLRQHGGQHRVTGQGRTGLAVQLERNGGPGRFGQAFQYCHDAGASLFAVSGRFISAPPAHGPGHTRGPAAAW
ncbi:hypothetical protein G6F46_015074 [Rhizopus delemar]|nr:hypothetical protein G6F46_015074 [Rhizopus delemar]